MHKSQYIDDKYIYIYIYILHDILQIGFCDQYINMDLYWRAN